MSDDLSPVLSLPLIQPAQAQKHVTHNEALRLLDVWCSRRWKAAALPRRPPFPPRARAGSCRQAPPGHGRSGRLGVSCAAAGLAGAGAPTPKAPSVPSSPNNRPAVASVAEVITVAPLASPVAENPSAVLYLSPCPAWIKSVAAADIARRWYHRRRSPAPDAETRPLHRPGLRLRRAGAQPEDHGGSAQIQRLHRHQIRRQPARKRRHALVELPVRQHRRARRDRPQPPPAASSMPPPPDGQPGTSASRVGP